MRLKIFIGTFLLLITSYVSLFAQGLPCDGQDPDAICPLDTWVIVLAFVAVTFAAFRLHRKQKASLQQA